MEGATLTLPITHSDWPGWWLRSSFLVGSVWWWWCCPPSTPQAFGMPPSHFLPPLPRPPPPPGSQSGRSTDAWPPPEQKLALAFWTAEKWLRAAVVTWEMTPSDFQASHLALFTKSSNPGLGVLQGPWVACRGSHRTRDVREDVVNRPERTVDDSRAKLIALLSYMI